jgi:glycosyltransferase involved in cell wall biosynthesis
MRQLKVAFDASQTGRRKSGCGFYAASLLDGLLSIDNGLEITKLTSFGDFYHDPTQVIADTCNSREVKYGPRFLRRERASEYWLDKSKGGGFLDEYDVVHANSFWCPPWPIRGKLIYTLYDMSFIEHPEWSTRKNRKGCLEGIRRAKMFATKFVAISEATRISFLRHFPSVDPDRVKVIYPGSRYTIMTSDKKLKKPRNTFFSKESLFFLTTGTIEPRKNHNFLIRVYECYRDRGGQAISLVIAGKQGWLMDGFRKRVMRSRWARDIHLLGYTSDEELAWLYRNCIANLYPSLYEGFGLPVLEGMSMGACTLSSDRTSMPEIVGAAGILLSPEDTEAWIEALNQVTSNTVYRSQLKSLALKQSAKFTWQESSSKIFALYNSYQ